MKKTTRIPNNVMNDVCLISSEALQKLIRKTVGVSPNVLVGMKRKIRRLDGSTATFEYVDFDDVGGQHYIQVDDMWSDRSYGDKQ